jgi:hypothetical protein
MQRGTGEVQVPAVSFTSLIFALSGVHTADLKLSFDPGSVGMSH